MELTEEFEKVKIPKGTDIGRFSVKYIVRNLPIV